MPLSKAKQAKYMQEYRKRLKSVIPNENERMARQMLPVQMEAFAIANKPVIPKLEAVGLKLNGNKILSKQLDADIPLYNPMKHRVGDRVLVQKGKRFIEIVIPELDDEGNPIPEYL